MKIVVVKDYKELSETAAKIIVDGVKEKPNTVLGLATGSTPIGTYEEIIRYHKDENIDFSEVVTFNLDEYIGVGKEHEGSYNYFMNEHLFNHINVNKENIHIPDGLVDEDKIDEYVKEYDREIEDAGGIDIQLLGIGSNGHIGFNEPAEELSSGTCVIELTESTLKDNLKYFDHIDEVPRTAITLGMGGIMKAKKIVMIINGKNKHKVVKDLLEKDVITTKLPASLLRLHRDATIIIDEEAYYGK